MKRRSVLAGTAAMLSLPAFSQLQPLALRLVRRTGWQELMGKNQCVIGDMYLTTTAFPVSDPGTKLANALELAYRGNLAEISAIPPGDYSGFVRTDGGLGWRVELKGTAPRENVQIHIGNRTADTVGCILLGTGNSTDAQCNVAGSAAAMDKLKAAYADASNKRPVVLRIQA